MMKEKQYIAQVKWDEEPNPGVFILAIIMATIGLSALIYGVIFIQPNAALIFFLLLPNAFIAAVGLVILSAPEIWAGSGKKVILKEIKTKSDK